MTTEAQDRARRNHELRAIKNGARRMPGGIMPAEAAEALDAICRRTGEAKLAVITRLLIAEAATSEPAQTPDA